MSAVIDYVESLRAFHELSQLGRPPTLREYAERLGVASTHTASYRIDRLIELGWLESVSTRPGDSRAYVVSERGKQALGIVPVPAPGGRDEEYGGKQCP